MSKQPASCNIIYDRDGAIKSFVCQNLGISTDWVGQESMTLGFISENQLIGGLIYHNIRLGCDLWWSIYTTSPKWCNKGILCQIFGIAFKVFGVRRISLLVKADNQRCLNFIEKLGFKREGCLHQFNEDGTDSYIYGMLKSENKWKGKK